MAAMTSSVVLFCVEVSFGQFWYVTLCWAKTRQLGCVQLSSVLLCSGCCVKARQLR